MTSAGGNIPSAIPPVKSPVELVSTSGGLGGQSCDGVVDLLSCVGEYPCVGLAAGGISSSVLDQAQFVQAGEQLGCLSLVCDPRVLANRAVGGAWVLSDGDQDSHRAVGEAHRQLLQG